MVHPNNPDSPSGPAKTIWRTKAVTDVAPALDDWEGKGSLRWEGGKLYKWVYNASGGVTVAGAPYYYDMSVAQTMVDIYKAANADLMFMAGIATSVIVSTGYGWILVEGIYNAVAAIDGDTTIAVGDALIGVNAAAYMAQGDAAATSPRYTRYVIALEALAMESTTPAATTIKGYVKCI